MIKVLRVFWTAIFWIEEIFHLLFFQCFWTNEKGSSDILIWSQSKNGFWFSLKGLTKGKEMNLIGRKMDVQMMKKASRDHDIREKKLTAQWLKFFEWIKQNS